MSLVAGPGLSLAIELDGTPQVATSGSYERCGYSSARPTRTGHARRAAGANDLICRCGGLGWIIPGEQAEPGSG
jgi:hypothetical protein